MEKDAKEALQVTKEIVIKLIETGKVTATSFHQIFPAVYSTVYTTITTPTSRISTINNKPEDA